MGFPARFWILVLVRNLKDLDYAAQGAQHYSSRIHGTKREFYVKEVGVYSYYNISYCRWCCITVKKDNFIDDVYLPGKRAVKRSHNKGHI